MVIHPFRKRFGLKRSGRTEKVIAQQALSLKQQISHKISQKQKGFPIFQDENI